MSRVGPGQSHLSPSMKRPREVVDVDALPKSLAGASSSADTGSAASIEIVCGLTQPVAEAYKQRQHPHCYPAAQQPASDTQGSAPTQQAFASQRLNHAKLVNYDALVSSRSYRHTLHALLHGRGPAPTDPSRKESTNGCSCSSSGPTRSHLMVDTILLLASDGRVLVGEHGLNVEVDAQVAGSTIPGDVVACLTYQPRRTASEAPTDESTSCPVDHVQASSSSPESSVVRLLSLNLMALADEGERHDAAEANVKAVVNWMCQLLHSAAPGLAQLTELVKAHDEVLMQGSLTTFKPNIWTRSLLLPLVLGDSLRIGIGSGSPASAAERKTMTFLASPISGQLLSPRGAIEATPPVPAHTLPSAWIPSPELSSARQGVIFVFEMYALLLTQTESMFPLPSVTRRFALEFFASPLFVESVTTVVSQLLSTPEAESSGALPISALQVFKQLAVDMITLAVSETCSSDDAGPNDAVTSGTDSSFVLLKKEATEGVLTVLHRLTHVWVGRQSASPTSMLALSPASALLADIAETLAGQGTLRRVAQWFRKQEVNTAVSSTLAGAAPSAPVATRAWIETLKVPPTLDVIYSEYGVDRDAICQAIEAVRRLYTPSLSANGPRLLEAAMRAVYAETFGPVAHILSVIAAAEGTTAASGSGTGPRTSFARFHYHSWLCHQRVVHTTPLESIAAKAEPGKNPMHLFLPCKFRIAAARSHAFPATISSTSFDEVFFRSKFGMPFTISASVALDEDRKERRRAREPEAAAAQTQQREKRVATLTALTANTSALAWETRAAFVLVRLGHDSFTFPCALRGAPQLATQDSSRGSEVVVGAPPLLRFEGYVLSNKDLLASMLDTSAAFSPDGAPEAWIILAPLSRTACSAIAAVSGGGVRIADEIAWSQARARAWRLEMSGDTTKEIECSATHAAAADEDDEGEAEELYNQNGVLPPLTTVLAAMELIDVLGHVQQRLAQEQDLQRQSAAGAAASTVSARGGGSGQKKKVHPGQSSILGETLWADYIAGGGQADLSTALAPGLSLHTPGGGGGLIGLGSAAGGSSSGGFHSAFASIAGSVASADREALQHALSKYVDTASLTPAQIECLHTLVTKDGGVRMVEGSSGSGKTSLLRAAAKVMGTYHNLSRQSQARIYQPLLKENADTYQDLFQSSSSEGENAGPSLLAALRYVTPAVLERMDGHLRLHASLHQRTPPLFVQVKAITAAGTVENAALDEVATLKSLLSETYQRSLRAPLAEVIRRRIRQLHELMEEMSATLSVLDSPSRVSESGGASSSESVTRPLFLPLLPFVMSVSEQCGIAELAARSGKTWGEQIRELFGSADVHDELVSAAGENAMSGNGAADALAPSPSNFAAVALPASSKRSIVDYGADELAAWRTVYSEKQRELILTVLQGIREEVQQLFRTMVDLVHGVAATSQVLKATYVAATESDMLNNMSFLSLWRPTCVILDDIVGLRDTVLLSIPAPHCVLLSTPAEKAEDGPRSLSHAVVTAMMSSGRAAAGASLVFSLTTLTEVHRFLNADHASLVAMLLTTQFRDTVGETSGREGGPDDGDEHHGTDGAPEAADDTPHHHAAGRDAKAGNGTDDEDEGDDEPTENQHEVRGFGKRCNVTAWTHATSGTTALQADGAAAMFALKRLWKFEPTLRATVYFCSVEGAAAALVGARSESKSGPTTPVCERFESTLRYLPLFADGLHVDEVESDVAIVCLSGVVRKYQRLRARDESRQPQQRHEAEATTTWANRLMCWLRRCAASATRGMIIVACKEAAVSLGPFAIIERFALQTRHALKRHADWLPEDVGCEVIPMTCPDHSRSRQVAWVTHSAYGGCTVQHTGVERCAALCLKPYKGCSNPSHGCLLQCHCHLHELQSLPRDATVESDLCGKDTDSEAEYRRLVKMLETFPMAGALPHPERQLRHECCPFVCGKQLPCRHLCSKLCGEECGSCDVVELRELTCGQSVIAGIASGTNDILYRRFPHFQSLRCGEVAQPCMQMAWARCSRCGDRLERPCWLMKQLRDRHSGAQAGDAQEIELEETACKGCVALFNRVAAECNVEPVAVIDQWEDLNADMPEEVEKAVRAGGPLPRHLLSDESRVKLEKLITVASKKTALLAKKEALEVAQGLQKDQTDFSKAQKEYEENRQRRSDMEAAHRQEVKQAVQRWTALMRQKYTAQVEWNALTESVSKRLEEEAVAEAERQRMTLS